MSFDSQKTGTCSHLLCTTLICICGKLCSQSSQFYTEDHYAEIIPEFVDAVLN